MTIAPVYSVNLTSLLPLTPITPCREGALDTRDAAVLRNVQLREHSVYVHPIECI